MIKCETTNILALRIEKLTFGDSLDRSIERVMGTTKNSKNSANSRKKQKESNFSSYCSNCIQVHLDECEYNVSNQRIGSNTLLESDSNTVLQFDCSMFEK